MLKHIALPGERKLVNGNGREAALVSPEVRAIANTGKGKTGFCFWLLIIHDGHIIV